MSEYPDYVVSLPDSVLLNSVPVSRATFIALLDVSIKASPEGVDSDAETASLIDSSGVE